MTPLLGAQALSERFHHLTQSLHQYRHLWEPRPFVSVGLPWESQHPDVSAWARGLSNQSIDAIERAMRLPDEGLLLPSTYQVWWEQMERISAVGALPQASLALPEGMAGKQLQWRIPARKWSQIVPFGGAAMAAWPPNLTAIIDWCAGKGHLGRTLGYLRGGGVLAIERQPHLCALSEEMAARLGVTWQAQRADVLTPAAWSHLGPAQGVLALHACGVLTHALLREGVARGVEAFAASPCCPHFVAGASHYPPMSQAAQAAALPLTEKQLRLAIADELRASTRERNQRRKEMAYRLGLDLLWREASGEDRYHSAGNLPKDALELSFAAFCEMNAARLARPLPTQWSPEEIGQRGWELARQARGRALIRGLFRRPLELWLVLDRALYLVEHGYDVALGTFCAPTITPRNLMITATLPRV